MQEFIYCFFRITFEIRILSLKNNSYVLKEFIFYLKSIYPFLSILCISIYNTTNQSFNKI